MTMGDAGCTRAFSFVAVSISEICALLQADRDSLPQSLNQRHGCGRRANFAFVNDIGEHFAWREFSRRCGADMRQVVGLFPFRPGPQPACPSVDFFLRIGSRYRILAALQPCIDELAG
jgi:hypothetical protein